ncbi:MAG: succinate dehydrogenase cytochrome b subunit [Saprospiraceae bacterium]|nr:succinate dehydrogenase cytochrome b subunit [Saprospiraceae bacterium]
MKWLVTFFGSGIGKKLLMSLTGLFLILFLVVHLLGNLQLLKDDGGVAFNVYAHFMTTNPLIKTIAYGNYFFILLHAFVGISLALYNRNAKGQKYAVSHSMHTSWASKNMALLGTLILAFILIHMGDFWLKMKLDQLPMISYPGIEGEMKDLYFRVAEAFKNPVIVATYVVGLIVLAFHLLHGFQSAFQTLGINHKKYTPAIKAFGIAYSILTPLGYAIIPIYHFLLK